ncbi:glycoside hydrolase family 35 protein [Psychromicrobium lacuslunae]|uniref:Beta-galactosidase n=1 Tax=Psychromicrobium lacuslunae TaxID=1618207 RepID=A0A0D4BY65_9MICC|nr:glycoside hydrolase family 35 protein [Psychromicrobium lacuslunae]AJT41055.1 beta-galactosidase [Psychromicrobium lacuslunae]
MPSDNPALTTAEGKLFRYGKEHRLLGGAIHYFRVHPSQWADRLDRLKALGANTLDTYVAWNFHQRQPDADPDFTGWANLERFIELAAERELDVMVRPGPYICAEWDNGGFPGWLTGTPGIGLRSTERTYQEAVQRWFDVLLPRLTPLQASQGGPIVAFQAENEYGSYGDDPEYVAWTKQILHERGVTELIFSADGGNDFYLDGGSIDGMLATGTLGSRGAEAVHTWQRRRPGEHFIAAEFWNGWFDHWGEQHHRRDAQDAAANVAEILDAGGSVCLYMAHGGSNFELNSGANHDGALQPTVTSYDSDAPIAEDGRLTEKFHAIREVFGRFNQLPELGELAEPPRTLPLSSLDLAPGLSLLEAARSFSGTVSSVRPQSFEELGCYQGLVLYRAQPILPRGEFTLRVSGLHDRAIVFVDGEQLGVFEATEHEPLRLSGAGERAVVEVLVENQGRINYGHLLGQSKGIDGLLINQRLSFGWEQTPLALDELDQRRLAELTAVGHRDGSAAGFFSANLEVTEPLDTHLALPGSVKGFVWVNGFLLGRYWNRGPQQTLYLPAGLLQPGSNRLSILELEKAGSSVELLGAARLGSVGGGIEY